MKDYIELNPSLSNTEWYYVPKYGRIFTLLVCYALKHMNPTFVIDTKVFARQAQMNNKQVFSSFEKLVSLNVIKTKKHKKSFTITMDNEEIIRF